MDVVTVSPRFQIVLPPQARQSLGIRAGQKFQVLIYDGRIELIPVKPIKSMRGFAKGINTVIKREKDRV